MRIIVIADDITGAAEMAGIAFSAGLHTRLLTDVAEGTDGGNKIDVAEGTDGGNKIDVAKGTDGRSKAEVTVVATDTRSMTEEEAVAETRRICGCLRLGGDATVFKKTDSALRGHVLAELGVLMQATGAAACTFLPANPSKGRVVRGGVYYVGDKPIAETDFAFDPEFPAVASGLAERFPSAAAMGVEMPDAASADDVRRSVAAALQRGALLAGAADAFGELLRAKGFSAENRERQADDSCNGTSSRSNDISRRKDIRLSTTSLLLVCGSTQSKAVSVDATVSAMPIELYEGTSSDVCLWPMHDYATRRRLVLTIPHRSLTGHDVAVRLRRATAEMAARVVAVGRPDHLVIEGGATAFAVLRRLGWREFAVTAELAPGVVEMAAECGTLVTMKPGSYPWGQLWG